MRIEEVPSPQVSAELEDEVTALIQATLAWLEDPTDPADAAVGAAEAAVRRGPVLRAGEIVSRRFLLLEAQPPGPLTTAWSAFDLVEAQSVQLHVLHPQHHAAPELVARFAAGPRQQNALTTPGLAPVVCEATDWEGFHVAVFADAGDPSLPWDETALLEVAEALEALHDQDAAHGALTPQTVGLLDSGAVRITALGLYGPGAPGPYAPPETADPTWRPSPPSDVYALGMLMLRALRDEELPYWVARDPARLLADSDLPEPLADLIDRMVNWIPEERPTIAEVRAILQGDGDRRRQRATRLLDAGRVDAALARLQALLEASPDDHAARRLSAAALRTAERHEEAAQALATSMDDPTRSPEDLAGDLSALRELVSTTEDPQPLVEALERLAAEGRPAREIAVLELARMQDDADAPSAESWAQVLEAHRTPDQAREALERLAAMAADAEEWPTFVRWGRELYAYVDETDAAADLALRLGRTFHAHLDDPDNALMWLDRAQTQGHGDPGLPAMLRELRSARGEWGQLVDLLEQEAGRAEKAKATSALRAAARTARWALADELRATQLYDKMLVTTSDDEALRHRARHALQDRRPADAAATLAQLTAPSAHDACHRIDALVLAGEATVAVDALHAAIEAHPGHLGLLQRGLAMFFQQADTEALSLVSGRLADLVGPGGAGRRDAMLFLADADRHRGDLLSAAARYHACVDEDPEDASAWWGLVQLGWHASRTAAEPAWLRAAPRRFPAQEVVARLLVGMLASEAVDDWLSAAGIEVDVEASRLERTGAVVERLEQHGLVPSLLERLSEMAGDDEPWIEVVRRLWETGQADPFPVAVAYSWARPSWERFKGTNRTAMGPGRFRPTRPAGDLDSEEGWTRLLVRDHQRQLSEEGQPPMALELGHQPTLQVAVDGRPDHQIPVEHGTIIGSAPPAAVLLGDGPPERCRIDILAGRSYVVADEPVMVNGVATTSALLTDGAVIVMDGVRLVFWRDSPAQVLALPGEEEEGDEDNLDDKAPVFDDFPEEPTESGVTRDPIRAALFYRHDGSEHILPLVGERFVIGPGEDSDVQVGEGDQWKARILRPDIGRYLLEIAGLEGPGAPGNGRLLMKGETFEVAGLSFEFQIVEAMTPAPAPHREPPPPDVIPVLLLDNGSLVGEVIPITGDSFTIGRGRKNDLQLNADGKMSRHHCTLMVSADGVVSIRDNNSSNGTFVDGQPVDEVELYEGAHLQVGDFELEFRWGSRDGLTASPAPERDISYSNLFAEEPVSEDGDEPLDVTVPLRHAAPITVEDGRGKLEAANAALAVAVAALDEVHGAGRGRADLQLAVDATPRRFATLFNGVEAKATGLPEMVVMFNVAQRPGPAQRSLLNSALLDLVDRLVTTTVELLPEDRVDPFLMHLSTTKYRESLRA